MTRLTWGSSGTRVYENGVDRGVLYLPGQAGVSWSGLISVTEEPSGGAPRPYYFDGIKILNISSAEEFEATIEAFSSPNEFAQCDGVLAIQNGLYATQQPRKSFGFSYRSMVGNDTEGTDLGYKIHLVYNALAGPSSRTNSTASSGKSSPLTFSWKVTTLPPILSGYRPTAHFVVDSRYTSAGLLASLEDILYGTESVGASLPSVQDLYAMFTA